MNYITANILTFTQQTSDNSSSSQKQQSTERTMDSIINEESFPFDEINAFYILIFVMEDKGWREIMRPGMPGLQVLLKTIHK